MREGGELERVVAVSREPPAATSGRRSRCCGARGRKRPRSPSSACSLPSWRGRRGFGLPGFWLGKWVLPTLGRLATTFAPPRFVLQREVGGLYEVPRGRDPDPAGHGWPPPYGARTKPAPPRPTPEATDKANQRTTARSGRARPGGRDLISAREAPRSHAARPRKLALFTRECQAPLDSRCAQAIVPPAGTLMLRVPRARNCFPTRRFHK